MKLLPIASLLFGLSPAFGLDAPPSTPKETSFYERFFGEAAVQRDAARVTTPPPYWPGQTPRDAARSPVVGSSLKGEFRVTADGGGRAVLRPVPDDYGVRVMAEFGAAEAVPAEGSQLTLTAASGFIVTRIQPSAAGPLNVFVRADTGTEIAPPMSLKWGQSIEVVQKLLGGLRNITVTRRQEGSEEVVQVEGALPQGMRRWLFGFGEGVLTRVVFLYEKPEKETASVEEKFRVAVENYTKRYGDGERLSSLSQGESVPCPIRWKKPHTELTMQFVKAREGQETEDKLRIETIYAHPQAGGK